MKKVSHWSVGIALMAVALLTPSASYAQGDQKIVMRCLYDGYTNQTLDFVIDLAAKTVSETHTVSAGGSDVVENVQPKLTQVTDDQISWAFADANRSVTDTLNRYNGQVVEHIVFQGSNLTNHMSCQREQKQF